METIKIDDFTKFTFLSNVCYSPNGKNLCFVVTNADKTNNNYKSFIYQKKGNKYVKLTSGGKERNFIFIDDKTIIFAGDREEKKDENISSIFYKLSLTGGEATKELEFNIPVNQLYPLDNGDYLLTATLYPGYEELYKGDKKLLAKFKKERKENTDYEEVTQFPFWYNGSTFNKSGYTGLLYYKKKTKKLELLSPVGYAVENVKLTKDKKTVYYFLNEVETLNKWNGKRVLEKMTIASQEKEEIIISDESFQIYDFQLADSFILIVADKQEFGSCTDPDFYKLDYNTKELTLYAKYGLSIGSTVGSDIRYGSGYCSKMIGDTYYFTSTVFDSSYLNKLENGKVEEVIKKEGSIDCFDMYENQYTMVALYDMKGQELYDINGKQLSKFNEKVLKGKYVAKPEIFNFQSDKDNIHGFILKPINYDDTKKYPAIIDIHGGPKTVTGPVFYHEMQFWASKGYFVIYCNPTGSDGRGGKFADIRGNYGNQDYKDLMNFCDEVLKAYPAIDKDNFFETGGSYGGFMTNWIIGHTDRFKAVASQRSISNWFSFYGVADIGIDFSQDQNASSPWNKPEKLWSHSPMKYADKAVTPTLFIHSFEDYRCPIDQGYQMFSSLVEHGVETKMVLFRGENHELSRSGKPLHRIKRLTEITEWFEKHKG